MWTQTKPTLSYGATASPGPAHWRSSSPSQRPSTTHQNQELEESLAYLQQYVSKTGAPQSAGGTGGGNFGKGSMPLLGQPKVHPNLQQWLSAREGSAAHADHDAAPRPPPTFTAPAGVLVDAAPHRTSLHANNDSRRTLHSPHPITQQAIAAQQMGLLGHQPHIATALADPRPPTGAPPVHAIGTVATMGSVTQPQPQQLQSTPLFRGDDHDGNLVLMLTYLKNHYGRESSEASRGIDSMTPEDVLGLAQCFYIDAYRLVRAVREKSSAGCDEFYQHDANAAAIVPVVENIVRQPPALSVGPSPPSSVAHVNNTTNEPQRLFQASDGVATLSSASRPPTAEEAFPVFGAHQYATPLAPAPERTSFDARTNLEATPVVGTTRGTSQHLHHARGPSHHRRELSLEQQLRDIPRRVGVPNVSLKQGMQQLRLGAMMLKYCRSGPPHFRYFSVQDRSASHRGSERVQPHLTWAASINGNTSGQLSLLQLQEVLIGPVGPNAQRFVKNSVGVVVDHNKKPVDENMCFALLFADRTLELCATTESEYATWVGTLQSIVLRNREIRIQESDSH